MNNTLVKKLPAPQRHELYSRYILFRDTLVMTGETVVSFMQWARKFFTANPDWPTITSYQSNH